MKQLLLLILILALLTVACGGPSCTTIINGSDNTVTCTQNTASSGSDDAIGTIVLGLAALGIIVAVSIPLRLLSQSGGNYD